MPSFNYPHLNNQNLRTMKRFSSCPLLAVIFLLLTNCDKENRGDTDYSGKVNVDTKEATISLPGVVDVRILQRAFSGDATFTIKALDSASLPASPVQPAQHLRKILRLSSNTMTQKGRRPPEAMVPHFTAKLSKSGFSSAMLLLTPFRRLLPSIQTI